MVVLVGSVFWALGEVRQMRRMVEGVGLVRALGWKGTIQAKFLLIWFVIDILFFVRD